MKIPFSEAKLIKQDGRLGYMVDGEFYPRYNVILTDIVCNGCGEELGDRPANLPRVDLCDSCFHGFVDHACKVSPAQLLEDRLTGKIQ